jgi:hypothetical protein
MRECDAMACRKDAVVSSQQDALTAARRSIQAEIHARHAALSAYRSQAVSPFSLEQTITEGVALTARMLRAERCAVARLVEGGEALLLYAGIGWREDVAGRAHLAAGTACSAAMLSSTTAPSLLRTWRSTPISTSTRCLLGMRLGAPSSYRSGRRADRTAS